MRLQTRPVDELVVLDDRSSDSTLETAYRCVAAWNGLPTRITISQNPHNRGIVGNFEEALGRCQGDVIFLCDQDDHWHPNKVARMLLEFEQRPDLLLLYTNARLVDRYGKSLGATQFAALEVSRHEIDLVRSQRGFEALLTRNLVTGATVALRRELLALATPFPSTWVHDEWLAVVAAAVGVIDVLDECLIDYRQHGKNQIGMHRKTRIERIGEVFSQRGTFYQHEAERSTELLGHLERLGARVSADKLDSLRERIAHLRFRASLPPSRARRVVPIAGEALSGRYSRYGRGLRSIVRDLFETI